VIFILAIQISSVNLFFKLLLKGILLHSSLEFDFTQIPKDMAGLALFCKVTKSLNNVSQIKFISSKKTVLIDHKEWNIKLSI